MFKIIDGLNRGQIIQLPKSAERINTDATHNCTKTNGVLSKNEEKKTKKVHLSINDLQRNAIKQGVTTEDVMNCDRITKLKDKEYDMQATIDD